MEVNKCLSVYFSPYGGTRKNAELIIKSIRENAGLTPETAAKTENLDLLRDPLRETKIVEGGCLSIVCVPVYAGRVPAPAVEMLRRLKGQNTPAMAVVVYGNRDYDDALAELTDLLGENGFLVFGAAALLAEHSIFPEVAKGRPDEKDADSINSFVKKFLEKLHKFDITKDLDSSPIEVKGQRPYKEPGAVPIKPQVSKKCSNCGICASLCPVSAIDKADCRNFDKERCISCAACIRNCPKSARAFKGPVYAVAAAGFKGKCSERREAEVFVYPQGTP